MKAAVCYEHGKPLVVEEVDIDPPKKGEVKVRMAATAVCHSDIHSIRGELPGRLPVIAGHESSGYVDEIGEGVTSVKPGDPVVVSLVTACGKCYYCASGQSFLCNAQWPLDSEHRIHNKKGEGLFIGTRTGTFAEYCIVREPQLVKLPDDMPMDAASLLACGVITGFNSVVNRAQVRPFQSVAVIGVGGVGLNAVQGAAYSGAYPVIAVDMLDSKLKAAKKFGATHTVNAGNEKAVEEVKELTEGRGADHVFITVGNVSAIEQAFTMLGRRGSAYIIGLPPFKDTITLPPLSFIRDEKELKGAYMGSTRLSVDIPNLITLYKRGILKLDELITDRYPLDQINEAIESTESGEVLRNVIMF
ncbi:Zn-dependent alcohol dehydrogenase [Chloroflexota bacterium]